MQRLKYPIVLGLEFDGLVKKGVAAGVDEYDNLAKVLICQLKDHTFTGETFEKDDVDYVIAQIWFCQKNSLKAFIRALQTTLDSWNEDDDE